ncbi:hypothetical protein THIOM_005562 [Candidatus Thiomargarita nelsonii]|uniref:Uncharacterized protein n=1 Tax=Candidatus Thiomargarita nelsonii TaxID=1003181 RepID=A0A176RSW8_9GAMM|nr:hypothetical protein THIOM_005562 [Candidatus Thiomargarita nelsonii]
MILWNRIRIDLKRLKIYRSHDSALMPILSHKLQEHWDETLFSEVNSTGFFAMPIKSREQHDSYRTLGEILNYIAELSQNQQFSAKEHLIKALYQLQETTGLPDSIFQACLQPVLNELQNARFMGKKVGQIEQISRGIVVDSKSMWPLNRGTRVRQPLGVVVRDSEGKIISKAKVFCR